MSAINGASVLSSYLNIVECKEAIVKIIFTKSFCSYLNIVECKVNIILTGY